MDEAFMAQYLQAGRRATGTYCLSTSVSRAARHGSLESAGQLGTRHLKRPREVSSRADLHLHLHIIAVIWEVPQLPFPAIKHQEARLHHGVTCYLLQETIRRGEPNLGKLRVDLYPSLS